jgi:hypothetical protein
VPELIFTAHARDQMRERQIPEAAVYHVTGDADMVVVETTDARNIRASGPAERSSSSSVATRSRIVCGQSSIGRGDDDDDAEI